MRGLGSIVVAGLMVVPVLADWDPGDGHKMHYPQLPDPNGWDVNVTRFEQVSPWRLVADDWQCTESGPVTDIHFWGSWEQDVFGEVEWIDIGIWDDVPDPDPSNPDTYSHPGEELWFQSFHPGEFTIRDWGTGDQGWYDPFLQEWSRPDHSNIVQVNITDIHVPGAFEQEAGEIYWLAITVRLAEDSPGQFGWKTSLDNWNDDAVWVDLPTSGPIPWNELRDPLPPFESLDMAFVITPEPTSLGLALLGGLILLRRR